MTFFEYLKNKTQTQGVNPNAPNANNEPDLSYSANSSLGNQIVNGVSNVANKISNGVSNAVDKIASGVDAAKNWFTGAGEKVKEGVAILAPLIHKVVTLSSDIGRAFAERSTGKHGGALTDKAKELCRYGRRCALAVAA